MSIRNAILGWSERGAITDVRAALDMAGVLPHAQHWRAFLDRLLLWSGAVALAAAVVFFIAHNWNDLGKLAKFGLLEALVLAAALGYLPLGGSGGSTSGGRRGCWPSPAGPASRRSRCMPFSTGATRAAWRSWSIRSGWGAPTQRTAASCPICSCSQAAAFP